MGVINEYFVCDQCQGRDFVRIYNFSVRFRTVNFSDGLICDEVVEELYQCTQCGRTFLKPEIDARLRGIMDERHKSVAGVQGRG